MFVQLGLGVYVFLSNAWNRVPSARARCCAPADVTRAVPNSLWDACTITQRTFVMSLGRATWQRDSWQQWPREGDWGYDDKGKGKGKGSGKGSRPSLTVALETVQSALAEQAALAALSGVMPQPASAEWGPWAPAGSGTASWAQPPAFVPGTTQQRHAAPAPWCHGDPAQRQENCTFVQSLVSGLASGLVSVGTQMGTVASGALLAAVKTAVGARRQPDLVGDGSGRSAPPQQPADGRPPPDSLAERVASALTEVDRVDSDAARDAMVRRLAA